jgi:hypothetical protein
MCTKKAAFQGNAALDLRMGVSQMCGEKSNSQDCCQSSIGMFIEFSAARTRSSQVSQALLIQDIGTQ